MLELKLTVENIDYSGIAELALPVAKEKLSEKGGFAGQLLKKIPKEGMNEAFKGILNMIPQEQQDEILIGIINKYEDKIIEILQNAACDKGVNIKIWGIDVKKV